MAGVALATIQALDEQVRTKEERISELEDEVTQIRSEFEERLQRLEQGGRE